MKEYASEELQKKFAEGPVGVMVVRPDGMPKMGPSLVQWLLVCLVVSALVAYLAGAALEPGADGGAVFRVTALLALLGYGFSNVNDSIWKGVSWGVTFKFVFDGCLYAAATGAAFWWLWPAA
jgi:hypothetical protein